MLNKLINLCKYDPVFILTISIILLYMFACMPYTAGFPEP
jgi:hypothetical protein